MREKLLWVMILFLFIPKTIPAQNPNFTVGQNFRIFPDTVVQVETKIATHPLNPSVMACTAVTDVYPGGYTTGAYISTNAGINWTGTQAIKTQQNQIIITVGNPSIVIDKNGNFIICYIAANNKVGVSYSSNSGQYWSPNINLPGVDTADKCTSVTDDSPSSPYFGRSYIVYSERRGVYFSATSNGGANWSVAKRVSPPSYNSRIGASIAVGVSGEIYVIWPYLPETNDYIGFAKSTNGGLSWDSSDTAIPVDPLPFDFRVNLNLVKLNGLPVIAVDKSGSDRNGYLYIAASEKKASGNPALDNCDIVLHASSNNGGSWGIKSKVNQSDTLNLKYQLFPALCIDNFGGVNVTYIDTRNTATNDSFQVYLSHSENGGTTFQDIIISDHKFKLKQLPVEKKLFGVPGYIGTGIGSAISNNKIFSFWFDNYFEEYQGWVASVELNTRMTLIAIPQGYLNVNTGQLNSKDTIKVYLRSSSAPFHKVDSATGIMDSVNFTCKLSFCNVNNGIFYINVCQRNSIEIWSRNPVPIENNSNLSYDFTNSPTQAFGDNQVLVQNKWCMFSGDTNRDGMIDAADMVSIKNDASAFVSGYVMTDVNGDGITDASDLLITLNNNLNFASIMTP